MASGDSKTSTPRYDSDYGSFIYHPLYNKVTELSPIRKQATLKTNLLRVCNLFNKGAVNKWNETIDKVSRKLFASSDVGDSGFVDKTIDSGIVSDCSSIENESVSDKLTAFPTDENCNILPTSNKTDKLYQPYKYICTEVQEKLSRSIKVEFESRSQNENIYLSRLLGNDVSTNAILDNTQKADIKLDLLYELSARNCTSILSSILSYLTDEELRSVSNVCKHWQKIVCNDKNANNRRLAYINNKKIVASGPNKENRFQTASPAQRHHKTAFISVINVEAETVQPFIFDDLSGRFDSFIEEAQIIEETEALKKCPKCRYPAKAQSENKFCCTRKFCQHEFCKKCSGPYLNNHLCSVPELNDGLPKIIIGSKKSKKNLRRL